MNKKQKVFDAITARTASLHRRREEVAQLFLEGWSAEEIADNSVYSLKEIQNDIFYIIQHQDEFYY